ncbi:MAG TPA: hypothetical protein PK970_01720 [Hyphomicrobiaceae bacterium]|nr:hypothetical protein [Hyphomicrobiaceae bacterium]
MRAAFLASIGVLAGLLPLQFAGAAVGDGIRVEGEARHENLAVFMLRGPSAPGPVPMTLAEALDRGAVRVVETGSVNDLLIEAVGGDSVFIQAGDIVKGGQQDRVLMSSLLLTPGAGKVSIGSYCVEAGRWAQRGKEDIKQFSSAAEAVPSRVAKLVLNAAPSTEVVGERAESRRTIQTEGSRNPGGVRASPELPSAAGAARVSETLKRQKKIWDEVAETQAKLKANTGGAVAAAASATSLQLSLENERVRQSRAAYVAALEKVADGDDLVGFVVAINGRISSAEIYPSTALFRKMWPKQLAAAATEAVADKGRDIVAAAQPTTQDVEEFLASGQTGQSVQRKIGSVSEFTHVDSAKALFVEARSASGSWYHRSYVAKQ